MSKTVTQLRTMIREAADMENSDFIADSELLSYINQGGEALHKLKIASNEDYALTSVQFTLTTASNSYTLPATFYNLKGLDYQDGDRWIRVKQFNFAERDRYRDDAGFDGTYRLWYNPVWTELTQASDTVEDRDHEYIVAYAARKCLVKEESDAREFDAQLAKLERDIIATRAKRDVGGPRHVAEVRRDRTEDRLHTELTDLQYATARAYRLLASTLIIMCRTLPVRY